MKFQNQEELNQKNYGLNILNDEERIQISEIDYIMQALEVIPNFFIFI
jgi:hypothetical protein